jgi:kynurenine formamidase
MTSASALLVLFSGVLFAQQRPTVSAADIDRWMTELSNWGRWGKADQMGTVNLITAERKKRALAAVRDGVTISLARTVETAQAADNQYPFGHTMTATGAKPVLGAFSIDALSVTYHGYAHTHMDALCHMFHDGRMYNGYAQSEVTEKGAQKLAVTHYKNGIIARGVLIDLPRLKDVPYLEPGTPIYPEDIEAWERKAGIKVEAADVVFFRTGRWTRRIQRGPWDVSQQAAGLHASCAPWLRKRDVAMIGSDAGADVLPSGVPGVPMPIHRLMLVATGTPIFDNCDLEDAAELANRVGRWVFLLTAAPIPVPGGTGSPLNPLATF